MDLDFDLFFYYWGEFLKCSARVYTFLFISKIHPNTKIRDQNLSSSKVVTFHYVGACLLLKLLDFSQNVDLPIAMTTAKIFMKGKNLIPKINV